MRSDSDRRESLPIRGVVPTQWYHPWWPACPVGRDATTGSGRRALILGLVLVLAWGMLGLGWTQEKDKVPKGLKTKIELGYGYVERSGKYLKVLKQKDIYKYDEKGNEIEWAIYRPDGSLALKWIFKYDEKGNRIEWAKYNSDGSLDGKWIYKYDEKENELEKTTYSSDGSLFSKDIYRYDEKGNKIESAYYKSDGSLDGKWIYKYDEKGNEIERTEYQIKHKFGKLVEIPKEQTTYEYEYYPEDKTGPDK